MAGNYFKLADNAETTLNGNISDVVDSIVVTSVDTLPSTFPYLLTIWDESIYPDPSDDPAMEIVLIGGATGTTLTSVTRGYGDTSGVAHVTGNRISLLITKEIFTGGTYGIETIMDAHMDADTGDHGVGSDYISKTSKISQIGEFAATVVVGRSGAVDYLCDGVDDDVQIKAALDYVDGIGGGSVYLREGTYTISSTPQIKDYTCLIGSGSATILKADTNLNSSVIECIGDYSIVNNLRINGNKANNTSGNGLTLTNGARFITSDLYIFDCKDNGYELIGEVGNAAHASQNTNLRILNCDGNGVQINHDAYDTEFVNLWVGTCNIGVRIEEGHCFFNVIHVWGCTGAGVSLRGDKNRFLNGYVETNGGQGFDIYQSDRTIIVGVYINKNGTHGVVAGDSVDTIVNACEIISNGQDTTDTYSGVQLNNSDRNVITNNRIEDAETNKTKYGIEELGTSNYNVIANNNVSNAVTSQIRIVGVNSQAVNNVGYNPVGNFTAPAVPASTVNYTNAYGYPCQVLISGGTVTEIDIDDIATGLTSGMFVIPQSGTLNITYSVVPTWIWWGL